MCVRSCKKSEWKNVGAQIFTMLCECNDPYQRSGQLKKTSAGGEETHIFFT